MWPVQIELLRVGVADDRCVDSVSHENFSIESYRDDVSTRPTRPIARRTGPGSRFLSRRIVRHRQPGTETRFTELETTDNYGQVRGARTGKRAPHRDASTGDVRDPPGTVCFGSGGGQLRARVAGSTVPSTMWAARSVRRWLWLRACLRSRAKAWSTVRCSRWAIIPLACSMTTRLVRA